MGIPSPISPSPAQAPEKQAILGETPVVPIPIPAPSGGSEMQGETELERQSEMQGPEAKKQTKTETGGRISENDIWLYIVTISKFFQRVVLTDFYWTM